MSDHDVHGVTDGDRPGSGRPVVLHIEDNPSNRKLVQLVISRRPELELVEALDGETGLELARTLRPDLILLDLRLPGLSGEEVLAALRADAETASLRIVVISAEARPGETSRVIEAGAERYLVKPVDVEELLAVFDTVGTG